jgi:hypothetical protein
LTGDSKKAESGLDMERVATVALLIGLVVVGASLVYQQAQGRPSTTTVTYSTTTTYTVTRVGPVTFNYSSMPSQFIIGNYSVSVTQGTGYTLQTGAKVYTYEGFYTSFNVFSLGIGASSDVPFFWNTTSGPSTSHPPYDAMCYVLHSSASECPNSSTATVGTTDKVSIAWTKGGSTFWVTLTFE